MLWSKKDFIFVIEEGQANLGDFAKALAMIDAAALTGADAIEFQLARAEDFYVKSHPYFKTYSEREFSDSQIKDLIGCAKEKRIDFVAAPLSHKLIDTAVKAGCSGFNVNASDLTNPDIIDAVAGSGLPFCLSTLMAKEDEIDWAVNRALINGNVNFALLHGQHTMASGEEGVKVEHTSLGYIGALKKKYRLPVGFIDHTPLTWLPAAAVAAGADIVTKHLALARSEKGPDWQVCLEPEEMKEAVVRARDMRASIGIKTKQLAPGENMDRSVMRRSIVAARTIEAGKTIAREDIEFKRPGSGLDPIQYEQVVGKTVKRKILADDQIAFSDLGGKE